MLILALDLSLNCTGYSVLKYEDSRITIVEKGIINNKKIPTKLVGRKLLQIEEVLTDLFSRYLFQVIVKEASFNTGKIKSTQRTFEVLGVVLETCYKNGYTDIQEIAAVTVKKLVGGNGKCTKEEVKDALYSYVGYQHYQTEDVSDATAVGVAYVRKQRLPLELYKSVADE